MTIDSVCANMIDKVKNQCFKCENLGISSHFEGNVNYYIFCCNPLGQRITDDIENCQFSEIDKKNLKSSIEIHCAMHDIPIPDFVREL